MSTPIYVTECLMCKDLTSIEICRDCVNRLHKEGEQGNKKNDSLLCNSRRKISMNSRKLTLIILKF